MHQAELTDIIYAVYNGDRAMADLASEAILKKFILVNPRTHECVKPSPMGPRVVGDYQPGSMRMRIKGWIGPFLKAGSTFKIGEQEFCNRADVRGDETVPLYIFPATSEKIYHDSPVIITSDSHNDIWADTDR